MMLVDKLRDRFGVEPILRVIGVASSTYYGWVKQAAHPCRRRREDEQLLAEIRQIHEASGGTYGSPRVHATLRRQGRWVGRKRVERLMRADGLQGALVRKRWRIPSTRQDRATRHWTGSTASSPHPPRTGCGSPTPPASRSPRGCCGWPPCATPSPTGLWAGRPPTAATPTWCSAPWSTRSGHPGAPPRPCPGRRRTARPTPGPRRRCWRPAGGGLDDLRLADLARPAARGCHRSASGRT